MKNVWTENHCRLPVPGPVKLSSRTSSVRSSSAKMEIEKGLYRTEKKMEEAAEMKAWALKRRYETEAAGEKELAEVFQLVIKVCELEEQLTSDPKI